MRIHPPAKSKKVFCTGTLQGWKLFDWTSIDTRYPFLCLTFLFSALRIPDSFRVKTKNGLTISIANLEGWGPHKQKGGKGKSYIKTCTSTMRAIQRQRKAPEISDPVTIGEDKEEMQQRETQPE